MHAFTRVLYASAIANRKVITTTLVDNRISITPVMKRSSADNSVCAMLVVLTSERSIFSTSAHKSVSTSMNWEHHCAISSVITSYGLNIQYIASDADASRMPMMSCNRLPFTVVDGVGMRSGKNI